MIWQTCLFTLLAIRCCDAHIRTGSPLEQIKISVTELEKDFNITHSVAEGGSIFMHRLQSGLWAQANEKKIILGQMISMYSEMLKNMTKIKNSKHIKDIVAALEVYKIRYSEGLKKAKDLLELAKLPMNDTKIQFKAIVELESVLLEVNKEEIRRKRRSRAQNSKGQKPCRPSPSG